MNSLKVVAYILFNYIRAQRGVAHRTSSQTARRLVEIIKDALPGKLGDPAGQAKTFDVSSKLSCESQDWRPLARTAS